MCVCNEIDLTRDFFFGGAFHGDTGETSWHANTNVVIHNDPVNT